MVIASSCADQVNTDPNIIIIFADDKGYGDLECFGHPVIKTPHLNMMAEEGIRLTSFYAATFICAPSRAGLLTGRYPLRNESDNFGPASTDGSPLTEITVADVLKEADARIMAIGKWQILMEGTTI